MSDINRRMSSGAMRPASAAGGGPSTLERARRAAEGGSNSRMYDAVADSADTLWQRASALSTNVCTMMVARVRVCVRILRVMYERGDDVRCEISERECSTVAPRPKAFSIPRSARLPKLGSELLRKAVSAETDVLELNHSPRSGCLWSLAPDTTLPTSDGGGGGCRAGGRRACGGRC